MFRISRLSTSLIFRQSRAGRKRFLRDWLLINESIAVVLTLILAGEDLPSLEVAVMTFGALSLIIAPFSFYAVIHHKRSGLKKNIVDDFLWRHKLTYSVERPPLHYAFFNKFSRVVSRDIIKADTALDSGRGNRSFFLFEFTGKNPTPGGFATLKTAFIKILSKGKEDVSETYQCALVEIKTQVPLPIFEIKPEVYLKVKTVDFESPDFNKRFDVKAEDPNMMLWHFFPPDILEYLQNLKFPYYYIKTERHLKEPNRYALLIYRREWAFEMIDTEIEMEELYELALRLGREMYKSFS